jgi:hypothetical protein
LHGKAVRVALAASEPPQPPPDLRFGVDPLSSIHVPAGKTFYVEVDVPGSMCDHLGGASIRVPVHLDVATPFGTRTISAPVETCD